MKLKQNDFIYTPDEDTFNKAVAAFVAAGANHEPVLCDWDDAQGKFGVTLDEDNDLLSHVKPCSDDRIVSLTDLQGKQE